MLKVNVPAELEGIAFIQVVIQKESEQLVSANMCQSGTFDPSLVEDVHWQKKLEQAQNVIFCKELFAQLAREAIEVQAPVPHMVVGNQISCSLLPDIQLLITLWYKSGKFFLMYCLLKGAFINYVTNFGGGEVKKWLFLLILSTKNMLT